jgi:type IV secretory pathway VirB10-like protein
MIQSLCQSSDKHSSAIVREQLLAYFKQQSKSRKFYMLQLSKKVEKAEKQAERISRVVS